VSDDRKRIQMVPLMDIIKAIYSESIGIREVLSLENNQFRLRLVRS
jgi:hypothetical protein